MLDGDVRSYNHKAMHRQCITTQHNKSSPTTESKRSLKIHDAAEKSQIMQPTTSHLIPDAKGECVKAEESSRRANRCRCRAGLERGRLRTEEFHMDTEVNASSDPYGTSARAIKNY